jgi:hypothetical protein
MAKIAIQASRWRQREGVGHYLVEACHRHHRARNGDRLIVSTATTDIGNLRFHQRQDFRMSL